AAAVPGGARALTGPRPGAYFLPAPRPDASDGRAMKTYGTQAPREAPKRKSGLQRTQDFITILVASTAAAFVTLVLVSFGLFFQPGSTLAATVVSLVACCVLVVAGRQLPREYRESRPLGLLSLPPLGISCMAAIASGAFLGLYCYGSYGYFAMLYDHTRTYENVVPSTSAMAVADAGRVVFEAGAKIDQSQAVGYGDATGDRYCVAPIRGPSSDAKSHVEFWAAGVNCCGWSGEFICDDAADPSARSGIVVLDGPDLFAASNRDHYVHARRKAEARFGIAAAESPMYVRWVNSDNLDLLVTHYTWKAWAFIVVAALLYSALSAPFLWIALK
ncbi:unnamed protein product, partial [Prorocentrum cordatum]